MFYDDTLKETHDKIKSVLKEKAEDFTRKLETKIQEYENFVKNNLLEIIELKKLINEDEQKVSEMKKLPEEEKKTMFSISSRLKSNIEALMLKLEKVDKYLPEIEKRTLKEIIGLDGEKFKYKDGKGFYILEEDRKNFGPDHCKKCFEKLKWKNHSTSLRSTCGNKEDSKGCNSHCRFACENSDCKAEYCSNCAFPSDLDYCGCGNKMNRRNLYSNSCDICRNHIDSSTLAYECRACDYDVCVNCHDNKEKD